MGKDYSKIFCTTIAIALFVYYVFSILQLTKKDALTGLFNRQAYYSFINTNSKDITAVISIDMNGLKTINDVEGHMAGDEALTTIANCFKKSTKVKQPCKKTSEEELIQLIDRIKKKVSETKYHCAIGYCYLPGINKDIEEMIKQSDKMMYEDKAKYYLQTGKDRRGEA